MNRVDSLEKPTAPFPSAAEAALLKGSKIEAIKIVRQEQGVGLKEAKDLDDDPRPRRTRQPNLACRFVEDWGSTHVGYRFV